MMLAALTALDFTCSSDWLEKSSKIDPEAVLWVKQQLNNDLELVKLRNTDQIIIQTDKKKCLTTAAQAPSDISFYVMMSFSVPEVTWISLSKEMEKLGAVFVLSGLPNNSFKELSWKIQQLSKLGVNATIQIDPDLFTNNQIDRVPTFLIPRKEGSDKVSGSISLACALEKLGGLNK